MSRAGDSSTTLTPIFLARTEYANAVPEWSAWPDSGSHPNASPSFNTNDGASSGDVPTTTDRQPASAKSGISQPSISSLAS